MLDAGGGPGRYSVWLAERGYRVEHCDLSAEQVRLARDRVAERRLGSLVTCRRADLRALPYGDGAFDAVCCLGGPLSHVVDGEERAAATAELRRVARDRAPVFVSVIGRLAALQEIVDHWLAEEHGLLEPIRESGDYTADAVAEHGDGEGWAACHFFRAAELEAELDAAGLDVETLIGLEGIASNMQRQLAEADEGAVESVRELARDPDLREDRSVADLSEHILAVCRA